MRVATAAGSWMVGCVNSWVMQTCPNCVRSMRAWQGSFDVGPTTVCQAGPRGSELSGNAQCGSPKQLSERLTGRARLELDPACTVLPAADLCFPAVLFLRVLGAVTESL